MGVGFGPTVTGEMLAGGGHAGTVHATDESPGEQSGALGITLERTGADHGAALVIQIQHRGETQVEADRQHFGGHDPATLLSEVFGIRIVGNGTHRRQAHEALAQALHATTFLVHRQQQIRANRANGGAQLTHLARMLDVAGKMIRPPTSGWRNNWRSSAVSQVPATSTINEPCRPAVIEIP